jgi:formamidopyrimidine-DNA glycosylase
MPELPEVQTTVDGLNKTVKGFTIKDVWSDLPRKDHARKDEIKNLAFWNSFKKKVIGAKILQAERHGKNIFIRLNNGYTILIHMKMTGHLLFGKYRVAKNGDGHEHHNWTWWPDKQPTLQDPYNRFIHFMIHFTNGKHLAFCDARKFGKVTLIKTGDLTEKHVRDLGIDALDPEMTFKIFKERVLKRPTGRIKNVLMDQTLVAGIGNIYSDEMLWEAGIHPEEKPQNIPEEKMRAMYKCMKPLLKRGIKFGGDSTSDYRNIFGEKGDFQNKHQVYGKRGKPCARSGCRGVIIRKVVGGRSAHFCDTHQKLEKIKR